MAAILRARTIDHVNLTVKDMRPWFHDSLAARAGPYTGGIRDIAMKSL